MKNLASFFSAFILLCLMTNCKSATNTVVDHKVIRQANNAPEFFSPPPNTVLDSISCISPMLDARNGNEIILLSSSDGVGVYDVPEGTYGLIKGEALLLECATGKVKGIVKQ